VLPPQPRFTEMNRAYYVEDFNEILRFLLRLKGFAGQAAQDDNKQT